VITPSAPRVARAVPRTDRGRRERSGAQRAVGFAEEAEDAAIPRSGGTEREQARPALTPQRLADLLVRRPAAGPVGGSRMQCPRCQHENPTGQKFCGDCGARLAGSCPTCGAANPPGQKFCGGCGAALSRVDSREIAAPDAYTPKYLAEKILTSRSALEGERKQVTVLFADMKGSMELLADRDPEEARKILDPVLELMMEAVHRYEGTVNQVMGDGIMALFGAPLAHEDHAVRACYAALRMQESVKRHAEDARRALGVNVQIRVGLNSGEVVVRTIGSDLHMDYTAVGQTTHLAARMEQLASPGCILTTSGTLRLAEGYVEVRSGGSVLVKGLVEPLEIFELMGVGAAHSRLRAAAARGLTKFVGRSAELEQIDQALVAARAGSGRVVAVVGEAGVGKSRLFWEFTHSYRTHGCLVLESASVSYGKAAPYFPVIELLRTYFRIASRDEPRCIREKVTGKLLSLDADLEPALKGMLWLLDAPVEDPEWHRLDPSQQRRYTLDGIKQLLHRESQVQPVVVVFEDLHWIDTETQALLDSLVNSLPTVRLLLLVTYRPEYRHLWGGKTYYQQIRVDPLAAASLEEILDALLGRDPSLDVLKRLLIERAEGNPFFLEESVRTLVETKVLAGERGAYRLMKTLATTQVPATVQAVLAARIDRLPPADKRLLQAASVVGKDLPFALLHALAEEPEDALRGALARLEGAEFVYETRLFPELEHTFKHALTREVAYATLLVPQRRALHVAVGRALERLYADRLSDVVDRLAYHYSRAEEVQKAVEYLTRFAEKAARIAAHGEAVRALEEAVMYAERLRGEERDRRILDVVLRQAHSLFLLGRLQQTVDRLLQRRESLDRLRDPTVAGPYHFRLGHTYSFLGDHERAEQSLERALHEARACGDEPTMGEVYTVLSLEAFWLGQVLEGIRRGREAVSLLERAAKPGWLGMAHWVTGFNYILAGDFEEALEAAARADAIGTEIDDPRLQSYAAFATGWIHGMRGDYAAGVVACERSIERSPGPVNTAIARGLLGYVYLEQGDLDRAIPALTEAVTQLSQFQQRHSQVTFMVYLGEACLLAGQPEKARELATEALRLAREVGFGRGIGSAQIVLGRLALARRLLDEADAHLSEAIETFDAMQARYMVARVRLDLAELAEARGNVTAVTTHLRTAREFFKLAGAAKLVGRTEQLAERLGAPLPAEAVVEGAI
jgi:class 3 adenylate cyclase/tetratricopeptide (TPR) repeat protein